MTVPQTPAPPPSAGPPQTVTVTITPPPTYSKNWGIAGCIFLAGRYICAIPMLIVLYIFGIGAFFIAWFAQFSVASRGEYPQNSYDFVTRYIRWSARIQAFIFGLTDKYPTMDDMQP